MQERYKLDTEAVETARRLATDTECDRTDLLDRLCAEGYDQETARRAVQRLSFDDEPSVVAHSG